MTLQGLWSSTTLVKTLVFLETVSRACTRSFFLGEVHPSFGAVVDAVAFDRVVVLLGDKHEPGLLGRMYTQ